MAKIERLSIQGFRSFGGNTEKLEFNAPISVIWGPNSGGKTSLAEAIEFLFTGDIARRELLASAVDEFENALRNAHLQEEAEVFVEASITDEEGKAHILRRELLEDFTKRKMCRSKLTLDGTEICPDELSKVGIELSEPPLAAPVLMQHTLGYLFSANPKERASYFKTLLELADLDEVREALREIDKRIPAAPTVYREILTNCTSALAEAGEVLAPLAAGTHTASEIEAKVAEAAMNLVTSAGEQPKPILSEVLDQLETIVVERQSREFPVAALEKGTGGTSWNAPGAEAWGHINSFREKIILVDQESMKLVEVYQKVIDLSLVSDSSGAVDCPLCETPTGLTQNRIQAIRKIVEDEKEFSSAKTAAIDALSSLKSYVDGLDTFSSSTCPEFVNWDRTRRIAEGFRLDIMADLLGAGHQPAITTWLKAAGTLIRARRAISRLSSEAAKIVEKCQKDVVGLKGNDELETAILPLNNATQVFDDAVIEYQAAVEPLMVPLKLTVAEKSDTKGWDDLVSLGRSSDDLASELQTATARLQLSGELEDACKQVEAAKEAVLEDKFEGLASEVRDWWNLLRPDEAAFFSDLGLRKKTQRTIDFKVGLAPSTDRKNPKLRNAIAVFSQSQMHCLGLATFLARVGNRDGVVVLDDPIVSIDDDFSVHFFTAVLQELCERNIQVIMLTHNQKSWREIQNRYDGGRSEAFQLHLDDPAIGTSIIKSGDALAAMLKACDPFTKSNLLAPRKECCQKIRDCAERLCKELLVSKRREQGDPTAMLADYSGADGNLGGLIPKVTPYLDADEPGKLNSIRDHTNPGNHDDDVPAKNMLGVFLGI